MPKIDAAVLFSVDEPLVVERLDLREPGNREVLVRLQASGVCHSDLHVARGDWNRALPVVLGHEGAGIVEAIGPGVATLDVGDHVVLSWTPYCGSCATCAAGRPVLCERASSLTAGAPRLTRKGEPVHSGAGVGAFATHTVVPETGAVPIRRDVPFDVAAIVGCAVTTGIGAVTTTADAHAGDDLLVIGCGGVGLSAVLGGRLVSAGRIIAVDLHAEKLRLASDLGATHTIDASTEDVLHRVREITGGRGVDVAIEAIGFPGTIEQAIEAVAAGGAAIVVGQVADGVRVSFDPYALSDREKRILGSNYGSARPHQDFPKLLDLYAQGRLDLDPLIAERIPLEQINSAFEGLAAGRATRTVIIYPAVTGE